ncbi:MAG: PaaI family thioesterase [Maricaulaceae bacterium]
MTSEALQARLNRAPYVGFLGVRVSVLGDEMTAVLPYRPTLIGNPLAEALHGGAVGAFMEITAQAQLFVRSQSDSFPKTIDVSVNYLRRGKAQDTFARARVGRHGSRVANVRVEAWQDRRDEPIAVLFGHFLIREAAAEPDPDGAPPQT